MPKICLITLGCPKNVVEGESIAGLLRQGGWELTTDLASADTAVVHTCSFISDAKKESEDAIDALCALKKSGALKQIAVTGCLVQKEGRALQKKFREVDVFAGTGSMGGIVSLLSRGRAFELGQPGGLLEPGAPRLLSSALPSAYLRVAEGCGHKCTFCIIPRLRGSYKSRAKESVLAEAEELVACGIKEINLIAQDTTLYGMDLYGKHALPELLGKLAGIRGLKWIRLMYAYPNTITRALTDVIRDEKKICKYIDMPVQHVSGGVLKRMGRAGGVKKIIAGLKENIPGLTLRSTLIAGFPGETEREFNELASYVSEGWFDHLGVFEYSPVAGTASSSYKGRVSAAVAGDRRAELMERQKTVVAARYGALKGKTVEALVEARKGAKTCKARAVFQAPEVDGGMTVRGDCRPGSFVKVKVTGQDGYDLKGEL